MTPRRPYQTEMASKSKLRQTVGWLDWLDWLDMGDSSRVGPDGTA